MAHIWPHMVRVKLFFIQGIVLGSGQILGRVLFYVISLGIGISLGKDQFFKRGIIFGSGHILGSGFILGGWLILGMDQFYNRGVTLGNGSFLDRGQFFGGVKQSIFGGGHCSKFRRGD